MNKDDLNTKDSFRAKLQKWRQKLKGDSLDVDFARKYFTLLVGQYKTLDKPIDNPVAKAEAEAIIQIPAREVSWEHIYRLELAILKLEPLETLCRKAWILREEYGEVANETEKARYAASNPPDPDPATVKAEELRADLVKIQEELNWAYLVLWVYEEFRSRLTRRLVLVTAAVGIVFGFLLDGPLDLRVWLGFSTTAKNPTLLTVAFAGMIGGLISTLRRVQITKLDGNSDLSLIELEKGQGSIYISPFLGAAFAVVLYVMFASGLLQGDLFPKFDFSNGIPIYGFAVELNGLDQAKLLIWSFLAGFAEKFVPDRLDELSKRGDDAKKK